MKKYYVAYFPDLEVGHWIHHFRNKFDDKSHLVAPHITLFYPAEMNSPEELRNELEQISKIFKKFRSKFRAVMMMPEVRESGFVSSIFLVPDEGFSDILRLHDLFYAGKFAHLLRLDVPFVPHITIGSNLNLSDAKLQVDQLNSMRFECEIEVDRLSIVEIDDPAKERIIISTLNLR